MQLLVVQRQREDAGVEFAFAQLTQDDFGLFLDQQQFQLRESLAHPRNDVRQQIRPQRRKDAESHRAGFRILAAARGFLHFLDIRHDPACALGRLTSRGRQHDVARCALHERDAEFLFEFLDLRRQCRLADEAGRCRTPEMFVVGECHQVLEVAQIHDDPLMASRIRDRLAWNRMKKVVECNAM